MRLRVEQSQTRALGRVQATVVWNWDVDVGCGKACVAWAAGGTKRPFATKVVVLAAVGERRWPHLPCD